MSKKQHEGRCIKITTKTRFGSHKNMVIKDLGDKVLCKDDFGEYITLKSRLDSGLADPARWSRTAATILGTEDELVETTI